MFFALLSVLNYNVLDFQFISYQLAYRLLLLKLMNNLLYIFVVWLLFITVVAPVVADVEEILLWACILP